MKRLFRYLFLICICVVAFFFVCLYYVLKDEDERIGELQS